MSDDMRLELFPNRLVAPTVTSTNCFYFQSPEVYLKIKGFSEKTHFWQFSVKKKNNKVTAIFRDKHFAFGNFQDNSNYATAYFIRLSLRFSYETRE